MGENTLFALRDTSPPADIPIDTMTATQCLDMLIHADKQRSRWEAIKARALARFAVIRRAGDGLEEGAPEEVAIELGMHPHTAAVQLSQAMISLRGCLLLRLRWRRVRLTMCVRRR